MQPDELQAFLESHESGVGMEVDLRTYFRGTSLRGSKGSLSFHRAKDRTEVMIVTELEPRDPVTCVMLK